MTLESIVEAYGYPAILVGSFLEGETIVVLGGFLAHRDYLHLPWVILCAFVGSFAGDQFCFYLGRRHSKRILNRHPRWQQRVERVNGMLVRYRIILVLGVRFFYGMRIAAPFVIGMGPLPAGLFLLLDAAGAILWAVVVATLGYLFGNALEALLGDLHDYEIAAMIAVLLAGVIVGVFYEIRQRLREGEEQN